MSGVSGGPVRRVDPQAPRQRGGCPVQLLVEVVPPPADRLREHQTGRQGVGEVGQPDPLAAAADPRPDRAERDRTPDPQAAVPDEQRPDRLLPGREVQLRVGDHVIQPAADDPERHRPHHHIGDVVGIPPGGRPPPAGQPHGDQDPGDDAQRIRPDRHRPQVPHPLRGARNVRHQLATTPLQVLSISKSQCRTWPGRPLRTSPPHQRPDGILADGADRTAYGGCPEPSMVSSSWRTGEPARRCRRRQQR